MTSGEDYINLAIDRLPHDAALRAQIAMELRGHIAERLERAQSIDDVVRQLGDPATLADSYLGAMPLTAASFWRRGAAKAIDLLMFIAIWGPLLWLVFHLEGALFAIGMPAVALLLPLFPLYFVAAEYRFDRSVGKHLLGMRVVRESGARIGLGQSFVRQLPQCRHVFWIDVMFALFTERSQRAFELLSHTRVVMVSSEEVSR